MFRIVVRSAMLVMLLTVNADLYAAPNAAAMEDVNWQAVSTTKQAQLVELFTSQGCSSCPPADRWLSQLGDSDRLWREVVPVAYHVTYWDYLGWQDPYADSNNDRHHRQLAANVKAGVYTPGLFKNRQEWRGWFRPRERTLPASKTPVGVLRAQGSMAAIDVSFTPITGTRIANPMVELVFMSLGNQTAVAAGENRGRELHHDFVRLESHQLKLAQANTENGGSNSAFTGVLPVTTPVGADAVAIWVLDGTRYLQATGAWLTSSTPRATVSAYQPK